MWKTATAVLSLVSNVTCDAVFELKSDFSLSQLGQAKDIAKTRRKA